MSARAVTFSFAVLLGALPTAALMLDADGRVTLANSAARALLRDGAGLVETAERRLRATLPQEERRLAPAIKAALAASREGRAMAERLVVNLRRPAGLSPLLVVLDPAPFDGRASAAGGHGVMLVRMVDEERSPDGRTFPLQTAFDLTAAEMRIAALMAAGLSPMTAARQLDLSTNTVRTHLARIFEKTGTKSQRALASLLAAIGSWPSS